MLHSQHYVFCFCFIAIIVLCFFSFRCLRFIAVLFFALYSVVVFLRFMAFILVFAL